MTCEIAVMNKRGLALAADSAVTIGDGEKIYHHGEKLFALSSGAPVGILIYGSAEIQMQDNQALWYQLPNVSGTDFRRKHLRASCETTYPRCPFWWTGHFRMWKSQLLAPYSCSSSLQRRTHISAAG